MDLPRTWWRGADRKRKRLPLELEKSCFAVEEGTSDVVIIHQWRIKGGPCEKGNFAKLPHSSGL